MKGFLIRVGIDSETIGYCAPIFVNDEFRFEYIPIPEKDPNSVETQTYSNVEVRNKKYGTCMSDFLDEDIEWTRESDGMKFFTKDWKLHYDPEFASYTFGDYWNDLPPKERGRIPREILNLINKEPFYLFFYAGLSKYNPETDVEVYQSPRSYFKVDKVVDTANLATKSWLSLENDFKENAHLKRGQKELETKPVLIKGASEDSKLLQKAIQLHYWNDKVGMYVPTDFGKKLGLPSNKGIRIVKKFDDEKTIMILDKIKELEGR